MQTINFVWSLQGIVKGQGLFLEDFKIQIRQRWVRVCIKQTKKRDLEKKINMNCAYFRNKTLLI